VKSKKRKPARSRITVLQQVCKLIPGHLVKKIAKETGAESKARTFSSWSHVVSMLYAQITRSIGLNDVCDSLQIHSGTLSAIRGATPPSRNGLSHANKSRTADMAEKLFWTMTDHLTNSFPQFAQGRMPRGLGRFKRRINIIDSTTIELVANCMDWAKHRRRKAAAKTHMRLDMESLLPRFAIVDSAKHNDNLRARELCAGLLDGEIVIFDRAYNDFDHLKDLDDRGVQWVGREKKGTACEVINTMEVSGDIVADDWIVLNNEMVVRRVTAWVEVDGKRKLFSFLSNNRQWSARSICDLYKARWQIEVFFKQIKQTLKLTDFLGHSANAVRWQVWTALLVYVILRFLSRMSSWTHSFTRIFAVVRASLWQRMDLLGFLKLLCGTAGGSFRNLARPEQAYFPGF